MLSQAHQRREFVRLTRRYEAGPIRGYILVVGPKFVLVQVVSDRCWYDGFECFRVLDITSVKVDPYAQFAESALRLRGQRRPKTPKVKMGSIRALIDSAGKLFPLIAIHLEQSEPDICHIGSVASTSQREVALLEIGPDAVWDSTNTPYLLRDITRVNFGGDYEEALHLVGGAA